MPTIESGYSENKKGSKRPSSNPTVTNTGTKPATSMGPNTGGNYQTTGTYTPTSNTTKPSTYIPTSTPTSNNALLNTKSGSTIESDNLIKAGSTSTVKPTTPAPTTTVKPPTTTTVAAPPVTNTTTPVPGAGTGNTNVFGVQRPEIGGQTPAGTEPAPANVVGGGVSNQSGNTLESSAIQTGSVIDSIASVGREFAAQSGEHAAAVAAQYTQMVSLLDKLEAQILGQIRGQMNGDDPGLQAAIGIIKEEALRMRDESLEDLNARGLVQSGVYAEMLTRLNKGELTQIQQVVGQRFGDLQNQLNSAMMNMAQARIQALGTSQTTVNNMMMNDRNTMANIGMKGAELGLTERGQNLQNEQFNNKLSQDKEIANMQNLTQRYGIDTNALTQVYGIDTTAASNKYSTDTGAAVQREGYDVTKRGQDMNYNASIYGANVSAANNAAELEYRNKALDADIASSQNRDKLARDQFDYTKSYNDTAMKDAHYKLATDILPCMVAKVKDGTENKAALITEIRTSFHPTVANWMINVINNTQQTATPQVDKTNTSANFNNYTPTQYGQTSAGYTPSRQLRY